MKEREREKKASSSSSTAEVLLKPTLASRKQALTSQVTEIGRLGELIKGPSHDTIDRKAFGDFDRPLAAVVGTCSVLRKLSSSRLEAEIS